MKTLKNIFMLILLLFAAVQVEAQTDKETTQRIINDQDYVFVATTAIPSNSADVNRIMNRIPGSTGGNINLVGSNYDLSVTKDSLVAYLPFYGRSYVARIGDREGGIKFKSKDFSYSIKAGKKSGWTITMKTKDVRDSYNSNYSLTLNVTASGYGTLLVNSNNQQFISFNGYLAEPKVKK